MNFDWMSFNFEDDLFSHFPSKSFKAWTQKSRSEFFLFCFHLWHIRDQLVLCDSGIIKHFAIWGQIKQL